MYTSLKKNIVMVLVLAGSLSLLKADSTYSITMGIQDSLKITLDTRNTSKSLWTLSGLTNQAIIKLSNAITNKGNDRLYDVSNGYEKYAKTDRLKQLASFFSVGYMSIFPYEQDYLFYANKPGTVSLTFSCTALPPVTINITVTNKQKTKHHTLHIKS